MMRAAVRLPGDASRVVFALAGATCLLATPATALDAEAFASALTRMPDSSPDIRLEYGDVTIDGDTIDVLDMTLVYPPSTGIGPRIPLGTGSFIGVTEEAVGAYRYRRATGPAMAGTSETEAGPIVWSVDGWTIEGGYLPNEGELAELVPNGSIGGLYDRFTLGPINIAFPHDVSLATGPTNVEFDWEAAPQRYRISMDDVVLDMTELELPDLLLAGWVRRTGYDRLMGRVLMDGSWQAREGTGVINYSIEVDGAGTLRQAYSLGGLTPDVITTMNESDPVVLESDDPVAAAAAMQDYLNDIAPIEIAGAAISFVDDGVVDAIFDLIEERTGTPRETLSGTAKGAVPVGLGAVGLGSLVAPAYQAVDVFLNDPGTIRVAVRPDAPVSVGEIIEAASVSPSAVAELLNVVIEAEAAAE